MESQIDLSRYTHADPLVAVESNRKRAMGEAALQLQRRSRAIARSADGDCDAPPLLRPTSERQRAQGPSQGFDVEREHAVRLLSVSKFVLGLRLQ